MTRPRVLMVISLFSPFRGGAEQQCLLLCRRLRAAGVEVCVLTRAMPGLPREDEVEGVPVLRAIRTLPWGKWFGLTYLLSTLWHLLRLRRTCDIIHCHILQGFHSPAAVVAGRLCGKPVVVKAAATGALSDFGLLRRSTLGGLWLALVRRAERVITICRASTREARAAGFAPGRVVCIPGGVDTDAFTPAASPGQGQTIVFVGRLDRMKGLHVLIDAFARLVRMVPDARLQIVGAGPERAALQEQARTAGLEGRVVFSGQQDDVRPFLHAGAVFALPSFSEGLPGVLLEAMACALPVVAARAGGVEDIVTHGQTGLLVDPGDAAGLADALQQVLADPAAARRLGRAGREHVLEHFSITHTAARYVQLYEELLGQD